MYKPADCLHYLEYKAGAPGFDNPSSRDRGRAPSTPKARHTRLCIPHAVPSGSRCPSLLLVERLPQVSVMMRRCCCCAGVVVLLGLLAARGAAAPNGPKPQLMKPVKTAVPYWHAPCGGNEDVEVVDPRNVDEEIRASLRSLRIQHELMMNDYLSRDYEFLYERVRIGVHEHQYVPNWLPGRHDVHAVKRLKHAKPQLIANHFPKLHSDLQKFAVALEEMVEDETITPKVQDALSTTQSYLKMMICEVETSIVSLPILHLPARIERSIMSETEREPVDDTRRLVRDWGILLKYKDYLHAWRHVFDY